MRKSLLIAAVVVLVVLIAAALLTKRNGSTERLRLVSGSNAPVTSDPQSLDAHNSPAIAQSPRDPASLVVANKIDRPLFNAAVHVSRDGGATWSSVSFPTPAGEDRPYGPDLAWAPDGTLYMSFVTLRGSGNNPGAVWITSSEDAGNTWTTPRRILGSYAFQVRMSVDHQDGDLFLTWLQASDDAVGTLSFVETGLPIMAARSTDGGATWSAPVRVNSPARERVGAAVSATSSEGDLYVLYVDFKDDRFDWENLEGDVYTGTFELVLARGDASGTEFTESVVEPQVVPYERFLVYLPKFPSLAVAPDGDIYVAWADGRNGDPDVFLRSSSDGGASWSSLVLDDDENEAEDQELPQVGIGPEGRVDLVYLTRAQSRRRRTAVFFATSADSGETWKEIELTSERFRGDFGPEGAPGEVDQGTQIGLVSDADRAVAVWTDARRGSPVTGRLDIFVAPAEFRALR
ncbi:MAG TPA: sialidase family protein [Actinomycetota bacterium]|nr:sialidase family protein [Actinomycetota bacterium]